MPLTTTAPRPELCANATVLHFEPGLYAITFHLPAPADPAALPCARLDPVGDAPHLTVVTSPAGGWVDSRTRAAHVLVTHPRAAAMLTIYRGSDAAPMPEIRFTPVASLAPPANGEWPGEWLGDPDGHEPLEGFVVTPPPGTAAADFEYQGIMGYSWRTPWVAGGEFCGSQGIRLALLGFQLRLRGDAAERLTCQAWGKFEGAGLVGPVGSGEDCFANAAPLLAMKVTLTPRA